MQMLDEDQIIVGSTWRFLYQNNTGAMSVI